MQKIKIILFIVSIILIFLAIRSIYCIYEEEKSYELRGWQTAPATCIQENSYAKSSTNNGTIRYYQRIYSYIVSGQEYTLNTIDINSRPYKSIKYNPNNPYEAETYEGINTETMVIFFMGLIGICSPLIFKFINTKKTDRLKHKILKMSKKNIIKIATVCFWGYLGLSLIAVLKEIFLTPNWSQIVAQYSQLEIILECIIFIIGRCDFKKSTSYSNIFWSYIWY